MGHAVQMSIYAIASFFPDIVRSMVSAETVKGVSHKALRDFLGKVASGAIVVLSQ